MSWRLPFGANLTENGVDFRVWAPGRRSMEVVIIAGPDAERIAAMKPEPGGWWSARVPGLGAGSLYRYRADEGDAYPDPASRFQPEGAHGPSMVVDPGAFTWTDGEWRGLPMDALVIYELHVGTATQEGTFDALVERLDALVDLGVTAVELMPVAQCPGERNWGYDGVQLFAPSAAYGGPDGLRRLVDAAHARGLAVILDVVYNHLGPEGNYLHPLTGGRFFNARHQTPWGDGIDYDGPSAAAVRPFMVGNALHWAHEYHLDGLRLDATHAIQDDSPRHIIAEIADAVRASLPSERHFVVIAEDERNERRVISPAEDGGWGLDGVWADDFHHQVRVMTAGDREAYFAAFSGGADDLARTIEQGWFFEGQAIPGDGPRGTPAGDLPPAAFVHCVQNHDQVGNRPFGDRLNHVVDLSVFRAACALLLLSPYTPLLWMGQEWAASTPFQYFTDHPDELGRLVTQGRRDEFSRFSAFRDPAQRDRIPDPQAFETFLRSRLRWEERDEMPHAGVLALHRELLRLRRTEPALRERSRGTFSAAAVGGRAVAVRRTAGDAQLLVVASFGGPLRVDLSDSEVTRAPAGGWNLLLSTEEGRFGGGEGWIVALAGETLELQGPGAVVLRAG